MRTISRLSLYQPEVLLSISASSSKFALTPSINQISNIIFAMQDRHASYTVRFNVVGLYLTTLNGYKCGLIVGLMLVMLLAQVGNVACTGSPVGR